MRSATVAAARRTAGRGQAPAGERFRLPDGTRSAQSPWVWRGFLLLSLVAFGLFLSLLLQHKDWYAGAWAFITLGWFTTAMWLWRKNVLLDRADRAAAARQRHGDPRRRRR